MRIAIIGGAGRCGTTTLYHYLGAHAKVCLSSTKETRFFLEPEIKEMRRYVYDGSLDKYKKYFEGCTRASIGLEASHDYLYSPQACRNIHESCPDAALIFLLREPISRLISWYRYGVQKNLFSLSWTFEDYVRFQRQRDPADKTYRASLLSLEQGRYVPHVQRYIDTFQRERLLILPYDRLRTDPQGLLRQTCLYLGIEPLPAGMEYKIYNASENVRNPTLNGWYQRMLNRVRLTLLEFPGVLRALKLLRRRVADPLVDKINPGVKTDLQISRLLLDELQAYYHDDRVAMQALLGDEFVPEFDPELSRVEIV